MTREIILTQSKIALVDDDDYEKVWNYRWRLMATKKFLYAGNAELGFLHRYIMKCPSGLCVDHINHNGLDNRKENLRICTYLQNRMNSKSSNKNGYKGICYYSKIKKYSAKICINHKNYYLGVFSTKEEAADAYNQKAIELYGEYACLNVINIPNS